VSVLLPRDRAMAELRPLVRKSHWLSLYGVLRACEQLDLRQLNELLVDVLSHQEQLEHNPLPLVELLLRERFGRM